MSKITLIRHGQASFGAQNYDRLSDLGRQQAAAVGEYFLQHQIKFDRIIHGQMSRQVETAQIMARSKQHASELLQDKGADEFDSDQLLSYYLPILAASSDDYYAKIYSQRKWFANGQDFEVIFRALLLLWQQDTNCPFESWLDFRQRVLSLFNRIETKFSGDKKIALVTSGGLISVAMQYILGFEDQTFTDMNLTINNASVTEIKLNRSTEKSTDQQKINAHLLCFNNISPLIMKQQPQLITRK